MTGRAFFGRRLRMARERQEPKLSRRELGEQVNVTDSAIAAWEIGRNIPDPNTLKRVEHILGVSDNLLQDIAECLVSGEKSQEYIGRWAHVESRAVTLLWFELIVIPGLLQTEEYARAILRDDDRIAVRMERQKVLTGEDPPVLVALIDECLLHRCVGGPEVMRAQLQHLEELAQHENVIIQIIRMRSPICGQYTGPFILANYNGETEIGFTDDALSGSVLESPDQVGSLRRIFEKFRGYALHEEASVNLIREAIKSWT